MEAKKASGGQKPRPKSSGTSQSKAKSASGHSSSQAKGKSTDVASTRPCPEHSFLTDVADVRQMEQGLLQLLDDFHSGNLQAFAGQDCTFDKMDQVREQQEKLARLHFDLDSLHEIQGNETSESREASNTKLEKLMDNLQDLCVSMSTFPYLLASQHLQKDYPPATS